MSEFEYSSNKPYLPQKENSKSFTSTVMSVLLFAVIFYYFITKDVLLISLIVLVLFVHEMGHYLLMKRYKYEDMSMIFIPFLGAMVQGKKTQGYSQIERANVILAGPLPGLILGVILFVLGAHFDQVYLIYAGVLFALINVMNLIPIDPLDGGQLLYLLFFDKKDTLRLYFLLFSSLLIIGIGLYFQNFIVIIFGFLLGLRVRAFQKIYGIHRDLRKINVNYVTTYDNLPDSDYRKIASVVLDHSTLAKKMTESDMIYTPEFEELMASEVNSVLEVPVKTDMSTTRRIFYLTAWFGSMVAVTVVFYQYFPKLIELAENLKAEM